MYIVFHIGSYLLQKLFNNMYINSIIIYQKSKFPFSCVSLVESVSRESDEIRLRLAKHRQSRVNKTYCFPRAQSISVDC